MHIKLSHYLFRPVSSHYLNQYWSIVNWIPGNRIQCNFHQHTTIFIQENAFEYVIWKMAAIMSWPQSVNRVSGWITQGGLTWFCPWLINFNVPTLKLCLPSMKKCCHNLGHWTLGDNLTRPIDLGFVWNTVWELVKKILNIDNGVLSWNIKI